MLHTKKKPWQKMNELKQRYSIQFGLEREGERETRSSCVTIQFELCQTGCYNENNNNTLQLHFGVILCFSLFIPIAFKADPEGTLRLKVNPTGFWLVRQCYESHVARSVDQTSLPLCLFLTKLNTHVKWCHI